MQSESDIELLTVQNNYPINYDCNASCTYTIHRDEIVLIIITKSSLSIPEDINNNIMIIGQLRAVGGQQKNYL